MVREREGGTETDGIKTVAQWEGRKRRTENERGGKRETNRVVE